MDKLKIASDPIVWDWKHLSSFFDKPVQLEFENGDRYLVGTGLGGVSRTFFERGQFCELNCGKCCVHAFNTVWQWLPGELTVGGCEPLLMKVNGEEFPVSVHFGDPARRDCDFLDEHKLCAIHLKGKPTHCMIHPQMATYPRDDKRYWYKRLPPRNWRWPQCPVNLSMSYPDQKEDLKILYRLWESLWRLPGCRIEEIIHKFASLYDLQVFDTLAKGTRLLTFEELLR